MKPRGPGTISTRYTLSNPIIKRHAIPSANSVFNSAVVPFKGGFAGVFRCDDRAVHMNIFAGFSEDGVNWNINHEPIEFQGDPEVTKLQYRYDPRVCLIEGKYYISWCNGYHGPTIGLGWTEDFVTFHQLENAFLPHNRNGVLFPRKINGEYMMLSRPSDTGHTPFGDIYLSRSPDLTYWGRHPLCLRNIGRLAEHQVGPGPTPHRDGRGVAVDLSRRADQLQRLCLPHGRGPA